MSLFNTPPSASPAFTVPAGDGPGSCAHCESEPGQFAQWRIRMMELAAESALTMLQKITEDTAAERTDPQADAGLAYSRISKALRQALMLHAKFEEDSYKTQREQAAEAAAQQAREAQRAAAIQAGAKATAGPDSATRDAAKGLPASDLFVYTLSDGAFAGAAIGGQVVGSAEETNHDAYGTNDPAVILGGRVPSPPYAASLTQLIDRAAGLHAAMRPSGGDASPAPNP